MATSSWTEIMDINGVKRKYDLASGLEIIDTTTPVANAATNVPTTGTTSGSVTTTKTPTDNYVFGDLTKAQQALMTTNALKYNAKIEADAIAANKKLYPDRVNSDGTFKAEINPKTGLAYAEAATIWNPNTGTKKAVRLNMVTGKILDEDIAALPTDLKNKWQLWTGGMASGQEALNAITKQVVPIAAKSPTVSTIYPQKDPYYRTGGNADKTTPYQMGSGIEGYDYALAKQAAEKAAKDAGLPSPSAPQVVVPAGAVYLPDTSQLSKLGSSRVLKDTYGKLYALPNKVQYIPTIAEMQKIPEAQRVIISGRWYKLI